MGRTSTYTAEIAEHICEMLELGQPLRQICRAEGMPAASSVIRWTEANKEFSERYARARTIGLDALAEEILDIADDTTSDTISDSEGNERQNAEWINRSRLRVDARKWLLSKMRPDKYGDRTALEHTGPGGAPLTVTVEFVKPKE